MLRVVFQSLSVMLFQFKRAGLAVVRVHWSGIGMLNLMRVWSVKKTGVGLLTQLSKMAKIGSSRIG